MTRVQQRASVAPGTITKYSEEVLMAGAISSGGAAGYAQQQKRRRASDAPDVHELVWAEVQKILNGTHGYSKWERISATEMVVR